jgi:L-amino acid N-acyltransferase YncA
MDRIQAVTDDWEQVRSIFREGIATGSTTFEIDAPSWETWDAGHLEIRDLWRETETKFWVGRL